MSAVSRAAPSPSAVELTIPADARHLASARMVSAAVGAEAGFSVDDVDELRIAVNEMLTVYLEALPAEARVALCFDTADDARGTTVHVSGNAVHSGHRPIAIDVDQLASRILSALTDSFAIEPSGFELRKSGSRTPS